MITKSTDYSVSFVKMILAKVANDPDRERSTLQFISGKCMKGECVTMSFEDEKLLPGHYVLMVEVDWEDEKKTNSFMLTAYSDVNFRLFTPKPQEYPDFLQEALISCARRKSERANYESIGDKNIFRTASILDSGAEYGFIYYENNSRDATLQEIVQITKQENFKFLEPLTEKPEQILVKVRPGNQYLAILKRSQRKAEFQTTYYPNLLYDETKLWAQIREKGKMQ
jgi:hypothetical protein